jgi:hypothetical protein
MGHGWSGLRRETVTVIPLRNRILERGVLLGWLRGFMWCSTNEYDMDMDMDMGRIKGIQVGFVTRLRFLK